MKRKIKVVMIGALPLDLESVKGGVEAAILNLFYGFSLRDDIEVVHLSFIKGLKIKREVSFARNIRIQFIPFKIQSRLLDYFFNRYELKRIIAQEAPQIIHIQESEPHLLRFIGFPKKNIVVTQHGIMREELKYASGIKNKLKFLFKSAIERYVFPDYKNVIFISEYNKKLFRGKLDCSAKIYNSVNPIFFSHTPPGQGDSHSMIYVGVINRRKNLKTVLEALHVLRQHGIVYKLHVVGWFKEHDIAFEHEVMTLVKQYELSGQTYFHGWLKQHQILSIFDLCNIFILPSMQETLPISIAEAMALGKKVIATNVGAIPEMFENKISGYLFERSDTKSLVTLLLEMNNEQKVTQQNSILIKTAAIEKYHPVGNAERTINFYEQVLSLRP